MKRRAALGAIGSAGWSASTALARAGQLQPPNPTVGAPSDPPPHAFGIQEVPGVVRGRMTGALAAARAFECMGAPCVFGVPGAQNNEFWDALKSRRVPYLLVAQESAASVMADASARVTGGVGVCALIPGPGLTNAMTGIGEALLDTSPVVCLVTDVQRGPKAPVGQVHSLPNAAILRTVTKSVIEVHHEGQIPGAILRAYRLAEAGPPGPVGVVVPYDLYMKVWDYDEPVPVELQPPWDEAVYRQVVHVLASPNCRVGIYAGLGCSKAVPELRAVAELLQAPVSTTVSGKGVLDDHHPLAVGWGYGAFGTEAAERSFEDVDVVLAVGARFSEVSTANYALPKDKRLVHVDLDPSVLGRNLPTQVAVRADAKTFLGRLLGDAERLRRAPDPSLPRRIHTLRHKEAKAARQVKIRHGVDPMRFLALLGDALGPAGLLFVDVTASTHWAAEAVRVRGPRHFFTPADNQSMGWAVSAAIGAKRIRPDLPVAGVVGDGCFLMSGLEASTAARAHLPVKLFVLDDGAYHYMQMLQEPLYGRTTATELAPLDYQALARGMGLTYARIQANEEVAPALRTILGHPSPTLTQVHISYDGRAIRWLDALRSSYLDKLDSRQKARLAARVVARRVNPILKDD